MQSPIHRIGWLHPVFCYILQQCSLVNFEICLYFCCRLVSGAGDIKLTKDGNVLLHEMVCFNPEFIVKTLLLVIVSTHKQLIFLFLLERNEKKLQKFRILNWFPNK